MAKIKGEGNGAGVESTQSKSEEKKVLLNNLQYNASEVLVGLETLASNPENADLHQAGVISVITGKIARRIFIASKMGIPEEDILAALNEGFNKNKTR